MNFLVASLLLGLVAAIPTPTGLPYSCTTITPNSLQVLDNSSPELPFPKALSTGSSSLVIIHSDNNASNPTHSLQLVEFQVPPNAKACQLQIADPACSLAFTDTNDDPIYDSVHLKVISLQHNSLSTNTSYNDIFKAEPSLVSSWDFGDVMMSAGDAMIFNSEGCPEAVGGQNGKVPYVLDYERVQEGYSELIISQQDADVEKGIELNGMYLTYC